jgi:hypothetical protein
MHPFATFVPPNGGALVRAGPNTFISLFVSRGRVSKHCDLALLSCTHPPSCWSALHLVPDAGHGAPMRGWALASAASQYGFQDGICNAFLKLSCCDALLASVGTPHPRGKVCRSRCNGGKAKHESLGAEAIATLENCSLRSLIGPSPLGDRRADEVKGAVALGWVCWWRPAL